MSFKLEAINILIDKRAMKVNSFVKEEIVVFSGSNRDCDLHIAFAIDDNFIKPTVISMVSIIFNNPNRSLHFHICTTSISGDNLDKIKELSMNGNLLTIHIFDDNIFSEYQILKHLPISMYYRLVIPSILKGIATQILYLDADIICNGGIDELLNQCIDNYVIAACIDYAVVSKLPNYISELGLGCYKNYFNSGVMLINVRRWHDDDVLFHFNEIISKRRYRFPDQDVLNVVLENRVLFLTKKFNVFSTRNKSNDVVFLHFAGGSKPWKNIANRHGLYAKYYELSPWKDENLPMPKNRKECIKHAIKLCKDGKYVTSVYWIFKMLIKNN